MHAVHGRRGNPTTQQPETDNGQVPLPPVQEPTACPVLGQWNDPGLIDGSDQLNPVSQACSYELLNWPFATGILDFGLEW